MEDHSQFPHTKFTLRDSCLAWVKLRLFSRVALAWDIYSLSECNFISSLIYKRIIFGWDSSSAIEAALFKTNSSPLQEIRETQPKI